MFLNKRYLIREVYDKVQLKIQRLMWNLVENIEDDKDYLQVFEVIPNNNEFVKKVYKQEIFKFILAIR